MKVAIIGSRNAVVTNLKDYLPEDTDEIVSGGAKGIDTCAKQFAIENGIKYTEFLPDYSHYKRGAPLIRNKQIVEYADTVIAFWDGKSKGTKFVIDYCNKISKKVHVVSI